MPLAATLAGSYDYRLVAFSVFIAILASHAALDLGGRVTASRGRIQFTWLIGGSCAMGMGIWSMHYIGMLAYSLPVTIHYHWPTVLLSLAAAIFASAVALFVVSRNTMRPMRTAIGGLLMGSGIASMHYIGMAAMRVPAMCHYTTWIVVLSVVLAILISLVALSLTFHLRTQTKSMGWRKLVSALLMGVAIPVMHYTGMAAVVFSPMDQPVDLVHTMEITSLGVVVIGGATFMVLFLAIFTSVIDRRFSAQSLELQRSEQSYRQLVESVQVILWRGDVGSTAFSYINREAEDLLGYPSEMWTSTPAFWIDHVHAEDRDFAESHYRAVAQNQGPRPFDHRMIAASGKVVWLRTSVRLTGGEGERKEIVGVMADITERKQAQEAAESASRAKSEYLAEIKRLHDQLKQENIRMSAELEVTRRLQQMILPSDEEMHAIATLDVSGLMEPASEVGGDYFDVISREGSVVFGIGDVTGHGLESGVLAIMVQTAVRTLLASGPHKNQTFFDILNRVIYGNARRMKCDRNLSFSLLQYHHNLVTISGQHEEVLIVRGDGTLERHDTMDLGFPLGLEEDISMFIDEATVPLLQGDVMVLYTDGITEAVNSHGNTFGIERLSEAVRINHTQRADVIREAVLSSLHKYTDGQSLLDDISLLVVKPAHCQEGLAIADEQRCGD
jgi:PAS domain S-box-containing protein